MDKIKVVFMGTPEFSVPILEGLIENYDVIGVVSQPDKKVGRKQIVTVTPVKKIALEHNIKVIQPINIRLDYQEILDLKPDIIITCAYGQIIPKEILEYPSFGCINVHASLLPKLRGGAPIHKAIIEGHAKTGITIMYMDLKMDSGDIISQQEVEILDSDNLETLNHKLSIVGKNLLLETLPSILRKDNTRTKQEESEVTYAYNIKREEEHIDFNKSSREIFNQIRGLSPKPGAYALYQDQPLKIFSSLISKNIHNDKKPGTITKFYNEGIGVATKDGEIMITSLQLPGKKCVQAKDFMNGTKSSDWIGKELK